MSNTAADADDDLSLLTGDAAGEAIRTVVDAAGGRLMDWSVEQVDHQPGRSTATAYVARVSWSGGPATWERLGACTAPLPAGVARCGDGRTEIGLWRFPFDPDLPALPAALDPERMRDVLASAGLDPGDDKVGTRLRAYRPRRRAVVEVRGPAGRVFAKVVRPHRVRDLHERHRTAQAAGVPVPAPLGWTEDGLVVLAALPGHTLRHLLLADGPVSLDPDSVLATLDALPRPAATGSRRRTWGQRAPHYAEVVAAAVPELAAPARAIAAAVDHVAPEGPDVVVHGDFYESQIMVRGGSVVGLLDIDGLGVGERLDDAGCLLAHLSVLAAVRPERAAVIDDLGLRLHRRFVRDLDPATLARRTAAVVLSLATGPHRVQEPDWAARTADRITLAQRWLALSSAATKEDEGSLIWLSASPHLPVRT